MIFRPQCIPCINLMICVKMHIDPGTKDHLPQAQKSTDKKCLKGNDNVARILIIVYWFWLTDIRDAGFLIPNYWYIEATATLLIYHWNHSFHISWSTCTMLNEIIVESFQCSISYYNVIILSYWNIDITIVLSIIWHF